MRFGCNAKRKQKNSRGDGFQGPFSMFTPTRAEAMALGFLFTRPAGPVRVELPHQQRQVQT